MRVRRILIPIDFSLSSYIAVQAGAKLAARLRIEARLVHVIEPVQALGLDAAKLAEFDRVVTGAHGQKSSADLLIGSVADRLLRVSSAPVLCIPDAAVDEAER